MLPVEGENTGQQGQHDQHRIRKLILELEGLLATVGSYFGEGGSVSGESLALSPVLNLLFSAACLSLQEAFPHVSFLGSILRIKKSRKIECGFALNDFLVSSQHF